jgi:hypothetical protein
MPRNPYYKIDTPYLYDTALRWINDMLLCNRIRLKDVPRDIRTASCVYVSAFRISRGISCERYIEDLAILRDDICSLEEGYFYKGQLIDTLFDYLSIHDYEGDKRIEEFERSLPEAVLREMFKRRGLTQELIRSELKNRGFIE